MWLAKNPTLFGMAAIAHNIQKGAKFLRLYGLAEPPTTGQDRYDQIRIYQVKPSHLRPQHRQTHAFDVRKYVKPPN